MFSIVTGDETWLYYYDVPTKSQSRVRIFEEDDYPTMPKPYVKSQLKGLNFSAATELLGAWDKICAFIPDENWKDWFDDWFVRMNKCYSEIPQIDS